MFLHFENLLDLYFVLPITVQLIGFAPKAGRNNAILGIRAKHVSLCIT